MRKVLTIFVIVLLLGFHAGALRADIIVHLNGDGDVTGIDNLPITGVGLLNVTFHAQTYNDLFSSSDPYFLGNSADARTAATAIRDTLNDEDPIPTIDLGQQFEDNFAVPYSAATHYDGWGGDRQSGTFEEINPGGASRSGIYNAIATFNPVPEPSTLAALAGLLGMGLIGRWWRRRKAT